MKLPTIAQHAKQYNIIPNKQLGQNFIFDASLCDKITRCGGDIENQLVLEIGPGVGGLTRAILKQNPKNVIAVEQDLKLQLLLSDIQMSYSNLLIVYTDALSIQLKDFAQNTKLKILSNIPYNIGTALLIQWLHQLEYVDSITLMMQKEVVDRICSSPGSKSYGKLSVMVQALCNVNKCFEVSPNAFYPKPKVTSAVIHIEPIIANALNSNILKNLEIITQAAFHQRRKIIGTSLKDFDLSALSINKNLRAADISVETYVELAKLHLKHM